MSGRDLAGLIGVGILTIGIFAMGVSALALLFPRKPSGFATKADEDDATEAVNDRKPRQGHWSTN